MAFSATYPEDIIHKLSTFMRSPQRVMLSSDDLTLVGVKLYKKTVPPQDSGSMYPMLLNILSSFTYHQCVIFSNNSQTNTELCRRLQVGGYPVASISGTLTQHERNEVIRRLKNYEVRILVSTDLTARGVDIEHINLVINLDIPSDPETFIHRVGRTGRFGSYGAAVTFVTSAEDENRLDLIVRTYSCNVEEMPAKIPENIFVLQVDNPQSKPHAPDAFTRLPTQTQQRFQTEVGIVPSVETPDQSPPTQTKTQTQTQSLSQQKKQPALQQLQFQQQHHNRQVQFEERGRPRVQHCESQQVPKNSPVLIYIKDKGWPDPKPLHRLMETEEWSHPKSVDIRKRVRAWKYDVYYAKHASTQPISTSTPSNSPTPTHHGYVSKVPPDAIKPLVEIAAKKRNVSSGNYSTPIPSYTAFSQPHNFHTFHVGGSGSPGPRPANSGHHSSSASISSSNKDRKDNYYF